MKTCHGVWELLTFQATAELAAQQKQDQSLGHTLASPTTPSMVLQNIEAHSLPCHKLTDHLTALNCQHQTTSCIESDSMAKQ